MANLHRLTQIFHLTYVGVTNFLSDAVLGAVLEPRALRTVSVDWLNLDCRRSAGRRRAGGSNIPKRKPGIRSWRGVQRRIQVNGHFYGTNHHFSMDQAHLFTGLLT